jgi:hypothetical protein
MADIRIKDLATTAASTASDDFVAVDGSANGTRKLNAYSPTFGGNVTAAGNLILSATTPEINTGTGGLLIRRSDNSSVVTEVKTTALGGTSTLRLNSSAYGAFDIVATNSGGGAALQVLNGATQVAQFGGGTATQTTLAGNLTVSGGTIGTAASTNLTLNGGSSGASLVLGQGTSGYGTFTTGSASTQGLTAIATLAGNVTDALVTWNKGTSNNSGSGISFTVSNSGGAANQRTAAAIYGVMTDTTAGAELGSLKFCTRHAGIVSGAAALILGDTGNATFAGNLLIGTTVNSGALLQVGTNTTTSAGGMVFGTDSTLYRYSSSGLATDGTFKWSAFGVLGYGGGIVTIDALIGAGLAIRTNGTTTALTLDSSQNATFAGKVTNSTTTNTSIPNNTATTIATHTAGQVVFYSVKLDVNSNAGFAVIGQGSGGVPQILLQGGSQMTFSISGQSVQLTQTSGTNSTTNTVTTLRVM